ncbi:expressed unknown protein [Seminavis robusta]|uniref:Transmembrane protein n=1 Tax=Seminavis robusta TaxID=568900 RepID=A0A9N8HE51_9STRA|nr:expressed unknown protein [Seminavis robusta]|eukprot:Sro457_g146790.1 n/a (300) ;mRNA; r:2749-3648
MANEMSTLLPRGPQSVQASHGVSATVARIVYTLLGCTAIAIVMAAAGHSGILRGRTSAALLAFDETGVRVPTTNIDGNPVVNQVLRDVATMKFQIHSLEEEKRAMEANVERMSNDRKDLKAEMATMEASMKAFVDVFDEQVLRDDLHAQVGKLRERLDNDTSRLRDVIDELRPVCESHADDTSSLYDSMTELEAKSDTQGKDLQDLRADLTEHERAMKAFIHELIEADRSVSDKEGTEGQREQTDAVVANEQQDIAVQPENREQTKMKHWMSVSLLIVGITGGVLVIGFVILIAFDRCR